MKPEEAAKKPGFTKIKDTCNQAWLDGYLYVWIDTCCIDNRSSSELSEAINSMYKWYELAAVCYVYLVDLRCECSRLVETRAHKAIITEHVGCDVLVPELFAPEGPAKTYIPLPTQSDLPPMYEDGAGIHQEACVSCLRKCRWFSRGWTLQELIAPERLMFFGSDWNFIGSKRDLLCTLSDITGIDSIALSHRCKLEELSVAKRLSWAACRETTRIEDRAYSLLGLLNINMSLIYGEGERAITRLQEEIIRSSADSSILAWSRGLQHGLLTPSLSNFQACSKVILCDGATVAHSFELTHRGLKMRLPILKQGRKGTVRAFLGVLSCRMDDDFERVLCLHLKEQMADPTDFGETTVCSIEKCTQKCAKSETEGGSTTRLHLIDSKRLQSAKYRTVLIPRHNFHSFVSTSALRMMSSVWIRKLPPSLQIVEFFPSRQWSTKTCVMSKYRDLAWNRFTQCGGVLLKHTLNTTVAVCFFISPDGEFIKVLNGSQMSLQDICEDLESREPRNQRVQRRAVHQFRALPSSSPIRLQAILNLDIYMGEKVWCIELSQV